MQIIGSCPVEVFSEIQKPSKKMLMRDIWDRGIQTEEN